jgi:hypothetical protein
LINSILYDIINITMVDLIIWIMIMSFSLLVIYLWPISPILTILLIIGVFSWIVIQSSSEEDYSI